MWLNIALSLFCRDVEWLENGSSNFYELQQQQPHQRRVSGILSYLSYC